MTQSFTAHDRVVSRQVHKLFWRSTFVDVPGFVTWACTRPVAMLIYNIFIPFEVAYGLQAIITNQFDKVTGYALRVFLLGIVYCVLWAIGGVTICKNGQKSTEYIQRVVFENYIKKDYDYYSSTYVGSLGSQFTRLKDTFNDYMILILNAVTKQFIVVTASIAIIAYNSLLLAAVTVVSMLVVLSFTIVSSRWRLKYRRLLSEANSEVAGLAGDALSHGVTVKSFAAEIYERDRLGKAFVRQTYMQYLSWITSVPADVGRIFLATTSTVVLLVLTARLYQQHVISIAIVVLVQLYVIKLVNATHEIADLIKSYESVMSSAHQAVKTMLVQPTIIDPESPKKLPANAKFDIDIADVTFRYGDSKGNIAALRKVSLYIKQGEKVGIVGYSGSGKTTLTKLLLRFTDVTEGSIKVGGIDVRDMAQQQLRSCISYVPQEPLLFHRSIAENIAYGKPSASKKAVQQAGADAYVGEFVNELSNGYDTMVGERGIKLSGGQRQRVAVARALLRDAPILVLDEATSALDSKSELYIQKALWRLMRGRTALVIAHRLSTLQRMDRIVVMDKGKVVEQGTHQELLAMKNGIYAKLWEHQSGGYIALPETEK